MNWSDPTSVGAKLTQIATAVIAVIALVHPGFSVPGDVSATVASVSAAIAGAVQIAESFRHASIVKSQSAVKVAHAAAKAAAPAAPAVPPAA